MNLLSRPVDVLHNVEQKLELNFGPFQETRLTAKDMHPASMFFGVRYRVAGGRICTVDIVAVLHTSFPLFGETGNSIAKYMTAGKWKIGLLHGIIFKKCHLEFLNKKNHINVWRNGHLFYVICLDTNMKLIAN